MVEPVVEDMTEDTIFDVASLTKVLATAPSVMKLLEAGKVELDTPVVRYIPEFTGSGKERITLRHLLTHTSGLRAGLPTKPAWTGRASAIDLACAEPLPNEPGTMFRYSDINFILLGEIVRRVSGRPLNEYARSEFYEPLKMSDTSFNPSTTSKARIAPTSWAGGEMLRGIVHDPTARRMGGVAGHAGLFATAADIARYARMLLRHGNLDDAQIFKSETVAMMTSVQTPRGVKQARGLGWDIDSPYSSPRGELFPIGGFGHTGWTGGSVWVDPGSKTFVIFLCNRVHPSDGGNVIKLWKTLGTLAAQAVGLAPEKSTGSDTQ